MQRHAAGGYWGGGGSGALANPRGPAAPHETPEALVVCAASRKHGRNATTMGHIADEEQEAGGKRCYREVWPIRPKAALILLLIFIFSIV